jgi:methyltransferase (TIGR00027 family)
MNSIQTKIAPEHTAVRVALWRALHVQIDPKPSVFIDEVGLQLIADNTWRNRPDMNPDFSKSMRASIVGRARFIEDLVEEQIQKGVTQYVILGAGLDSFAQRRPELATNLQVFEVDQPGPQVWKKNRLKELGLAIPSWLHFVPVDFEAGHSWLEHLIEAGFDKTKPAIIVSAGVSMYLTKESNLALLQQVANLAHGSTFAMTFLLSLELLTGQEKASIEFVMKKASESGTPFHSLFSPSEILEMAKAAGFKKTSYVSANDLYQRYFANRSDGLNAGTAECFLVATT